MKKIIILVLEILLIAIKTGATPEDVTRETAKRYGVEFCDLWREVEKRYK